AGQTKTCPSCKRDITVPSLSAITPPVRTAIPATVHAESTVTDVDAPSADVESAGWAPEPAEASRNATMRLALVAVSIGSLVLLAAGFACYGVWSKWSELANEQVIRVEDSPSVTVEREVAQPVQPVSSSATTDNAEEEPDLPALPARPASAGPEEDERGQPPPAVAPAPPAKPPAATVSKFSVRRLKDLSDEDLRKQLLWTPELSMTPADIPPIAEAFLANVVAARKEQKILPLEPTYITARLPEFKTLPYRRGLSNRLDEKATGELHYLGKELHGILDRFAAKEGPSRSSVVVLREFMMQETLRNKEATWLRPGAIPALQQVLGFEDLPVRLLLVELLTKIDGRAASLALVQHAVFDLSVEVREAAIKALDGRPREQYRSALVGALRYPWAPAADHAAEALAALKDSAAAPLLVKLLKEPDPSAPFVKKDHLVKREVVRINHQNNCVACHPPAWLGNDPVQKAVPGFTVINNSTVVATATLPLASQSIIESGGTVKSPRIKPANRDGGYPHGPSTTTDNAESLNVRGDITYLRQDFSIQQPVQVTTTTPGVPLRFDYLVRTRPLTDKQTHEWKTQAKKEVGYEQRDAVLFALRELTGQDAGPTTEAWEKLYPLSEMESWTAELTQALVGAADYQKLGVIKKMRDAKGDAHAHALAQAIPQLEGVFPDKARAALVERMKRSDKSSLRDKLADENREMRLAAATAAGLKEERELIPDLTTLLGDLDSAVAEAAQAALKALKAREPGPSSPAP
ncbi:MAG TPA: HEAT repeat domain-containing protein, partial [Gemmataceae bacterium]